MPETASVLRVILLRMFSLKQDCWARRDVLLLKNKMALELVDFQKGVCVMVSLLS